MDKLISLLIILLIAVSAPAAVIHVNPNGTGDYPTIRDAVDAARDGDEVVLADGTYRLQGGSYIRIKRHITVRSENGPETCTIDCNGSPPEPRAAFQIDSDATIAGITIVNGKSREGGAIFCFGSELQIINCILRENYSRENGGAIACFHSGVTIINCRISNNTASMGGGIYCEEGSLYIDSCIINDNLAIEDYHGKGGGGICCLATGLTVINSSIINNIAQSNYNFGGGGILCGQMVNLAILNSVISGNICRAKDYGSGGGIYCESEYSEGECIIADSVIKENVAEFLTGGKLSYGGGMSFEYGSQPIISKCIINGNSAVVGSGIYFNRCYSTVDNSIISGNSHLLKTTYPNYQAGGISCDDSYTKVANCAILGNSGSGIYSDSDSTKIENSIIYANKYGKSYECQIIDRHSDSVTVSYSNVQMNEPNSPPWSGVGNINADPCFFNPGYWDSNGTPDNYWDDFWIGGAYHLKSDSPCIDSGGPVPLMLSNTDLDNKPRIVGSAIDMGAYETQLPAIEVKLFCVPRSINVHSHHKTIIAVLTMPDDIKPDDVDPNEPLFFEPCRVKSKRQIVYQRNWHGKSRTCIWAVFELSDCMDKFSDGPNKVTVKSRLKTGRRYYGTDTIRVVSWKWFR